MRALAQGSTSSPPLTYPGAVWPSLNFYPSSWNCSLVATISLSICPVISQVLQLYMILTPAQLDTYSGDTEKEMNKETMKSTLVPILPTNSQFWRHQHSLPYEITGWRAEKTLKGQDQIPGTSSACQVRSQSSLV
jgi:hypothetical protein